MDDARTRASRRTDRQDRRRAARAPDQGPEAWLRHRDRGAADRRPAGSQGLLHGARRRHEERADTAAALRSATGIIRSEVGRLIGLRHTPSLEFIADALPEDAQRIDELVAAVRERDAELARAREGAQWAGDPDPYKKPADDWRGRRRLGLDDEDDEDDEDE